MTNTGQAGKSEEDLPCLVPQRSRDEGRCERSLVEVFSTVMDSSRSSCTCHWLSSACPSGRQERTTGGGWRTLMGMSGWWGDWVVGRGVPSAAAELENRCDWMFSTAVTFTLRLSLPKPHFISISGDYTDLLLWNIISLSERLTRGVLLKKECHMHDPALWTRHNICVKHDTFWTSAM